MYGYGGYGYGGYGYGGSWIWIILVIFIIFFIVFWNNGPCNYCGCQHNCNN